MHSWFVVFTGLNGLMVTLLAMNVSYQRIKHKVANGDGGIIQLKKAIRAHGNAVEHSILFALLVLALSYQALSNLWLGVLVVGFTVTRLLHAASMLTSTFNLRRVAAASTYAHELIASMMIIELAL